MALFLPLLTYSLPLVRGALLFEDQQPSRLAAFRLHSASTHLYFPYRLDVGPGMVAL